MTGSRRRRVAAVTIAAGLAAFGAFVATPGTAVAAPTPARVPTSSVPATAPSTVAVPLHIESEIPSISNADLGAFVIQTLNDPRSWTSAGFRFTADPSSAYRVVLTSPAEVDRLCRPLLTRSRVSCQNGDVVALNSVRWATATTDWDRSIEDYRRYMVNHEVGHLIGQRHPEPRCPTKGTPAAVMEQQTKGLHGCTGNAWPLPWELERARARPATLAPAADWAPQPVPVNLGGASNGTTAPSTTSPSGAAASPTSTAPAPASGPSTSTPAASVAAAVTSSSSAPTARATTTSRPTASNGSSDQRASGTSTASPRHSAPTIILAVILTGGGLGLLWVAYWLFVGRRPDGSDAPNT